MILKGISENRLIEVIDKVANNHKNKCFAHYTPDDMKQIVWEICLRKLKDFVPARCKEKTVDKALENWLNKVISRQLINFYRDNYLVPTQQSKNNKNPDRAAKCTSLYSPSDLSLLATDKTPFFCSTLVDDLECWDYLINKLDAQQIDILDSILSGEVVNSYYRSKLQQQIIDILQEYKDA